MALTLPILSIITWSPFVAALMRPPVVISFAGTLPSARLPSPATIAASSGRKTMNRIEGTA